MSRSNRYYTAPGSTMERSRLLAVIAAGRKQRDGRGCRSWTDQGHSTTDASLTT